MRVKAFLTCLACMGAMTVAGAQDDQIAKGKQLCEQKKCTVCHKESSKKGKPLEELTKDKTDEFLKGALTDPKKTIDAKTKMPGYKFSDEESAAVIAYLKSIAKK